MYLARHHVNWKNAFYFDYMSDLFSFFVRFAKTDLGESIFGGRWHLSPENYPLSHVTFRVLIY